MPDSSAPAGGITSSSRATAAAGAAAPSSAQLSPPKAIALTPIGCLQGDDRRRQAEPPVGRAVAERPEHDEVGDEHDHQAPEHRLLAQAGRLVLQVVEPAAVVREALDHPVGEAEQAHLLGSRRVDRHAVGVLGVALGVQHLGRAAVAPDGALAQQPVRGRPGEHEQQRLPPAVPGQHDGRGDAGEQADEAVGDEVHGVRQRRPGDSEVEVAGHRQVVGEVGPFEVGDAWRLDRRRHQPVVERRRRALAEVGADDLVQRADDLGGDEHDGEGDERRGERLAVGDGGDQPARCDGDRRGQRATHDEAGPPDQRLRRRGAEERAEQDPLLAPAQAFDHDASSGRTSPHTCSPPAGSA